MSVADLSAATIQYSDNTTATLLLKSIGGPEAFNRYMQSLGDKITRLDRYEPEINTNIPLDPRDTTTPSAMTNTMHKLLVGNVLSPNSKELLLEWLIGNTTGDKKLRAGININWKVGDKTGSGENGASSDVAIVWPTDRKPWLIAVYYTDAKSSPEQQNAVIAKIGKIISDTFSSNQ
jgi:beta-lactamase class A